MKKLISRVFFITILLTTIPLTIFASENVGKQPKTIADLLYHSVDEADKITLRKAVNDRIVTKTVADKDFDLSIKKINISRTEKNSPIDMKGMYIEVLKKDGNMSFLYISELGEVDIYSIYMGRTPFCQYSIDDMAAANSLLNEIWDNAEKTPDSIDEKAKHLSINADDVSIYEQASILEALVTSMNKEQENAHEVTDITSSDWAKNDIKSALSLEIIPEKLAQGNYIEPISREDFCDLAYQMIEKVIGPPTEEIRNIYHDTDSAAPSILHHYSIILGYDDNEFWGDHFISREEVAVVVYRIARFLGIDRFLPDYRFSSYCYADDARIGGWAKESVYQLQYAKILTGVGNDLFAPQDSFTKEQTVAAILRLYHEIPPEEIGKREASDIIELASIEERQIILSAGKLHNGIYSDMNVHIKGNKKRFAWQTINAPSFLPEISCHDIDSDGKDELVVILCKGEGTGLLVEEIHILRMDDFSEVTFENPINTLKDRVHTQIVEGKVQIGIDKKPDIIMSESEVIAQIAEKEKWFDNLTTGSIVDYSIGNGHITAKIGAQISPAGFLGDFIINYESKNNRLEVDTIIFSSNIK